MSVGWLVGWLIGWILYDVQYILRPLYPPLHATSFPFFSSFFLSGFPFFHVSVGYRAFFSGRGGMSRRGGETSLLAAAGSWGITLQLLETAVEAMQLSHNI